METSNSSLKSTGFVAVMGRPNVGKSTLVNALLGQKIAPVSPRPQTTRKRQLGILTTGNAQVVFVDTPGVHHPHHKLGESMNQAAQEALEDAELILFLLDVSQEPTEEDQLLAGLLKKLPRQVPVIMALNKVDQVPPNEVEPRRQTFAGLAQAAEVLTVSATRGDNMAALLETIINHLPLGQAYYPEGQVTDVYERDIAGELIREAALLILRDEIPHGILVRVDEFIEREERGAYIAATIFVERESHKPIVIGQGGSMLKKIGTAARKEIEMMSGRKVFLELRVKVRKNWRNDEKSLKQFGLKE